MQTKDVKETIIEIITEILGLTSEEISYERKLQDYGLDSIVGVEMVGRLNKIYGLNLHKTAVYSYPTINQLTEYVLTALNDEKMEYYSSEDDYNNTALGRYGRSVGQEGSVTETYTKEENKEQSFNQIQIEKMVEKLTKKYGDIPKEVYEGCTKLEELAQRVSDYLNMRDVEDPEKN